jgi:hypothetical protein
MIVSTSYTTISITPNCHPAEKALMSLPSPLTASDEWIKARDTALEIVRVTACLHRQVWVSGTGIYVDVHIINNSRKCIKKIELQLERDILCYKHVRLAADTPNHLCDALIHCVYRPPRRPWRSRPAKHAFLMITNAQFSARV